MSLGRGILPDDDRLLAARHEAEALLGVPEQTHGPRLRRLLRLAPRPTGARVLVGGRAVDMAAGDRIRISQSRGELRFKQRLTLT